MRRRSFTDAQTPWGNAIDYRVPEVRGFAVENALYWLRDYRFDGLRLDAVHAIAEPGEASLLHELSKRGRRPCRADRPAHPSGAGKRRQPPQACSIPLADPPRGKYRAQWNDDYHHAWHVLLTGETARLLRRLSRRRARIIARALGPGFAYQGEPSAHRGGRPRGEPSGALAADGLRQFSAEPRPDRQPRARRAARRRSPTPAALEAALAITLLAPTPPLLFMGDEWGATAPFPFFCDFQGDLADAVRNGRRKEFAEAYAKYGDEVPDPLASTTVRSADARLGSARADAGHASGSIWCSGCSRSRQSEIVPRLAGAGFGERRCRPTTAC